ncbi:protein eva-1-like isoform X1 [Cydia splendana]|uniref:protein eva-1-like isoform X1 n=2 Tax=Cydia splendana TaxID=1100963 RepID=UPI002133CF27
MDQSNVAADVRAAMARKTGLLVLLWIAIFPLYRADNLELLLGTLRTHQKAACDEEMVSLICPRGTTISIQVAQYGASASQGSCASELAEYQPVAVEVVGDTSCSWPAALQYSLLQTVVEACQKKRQCKFHTSPKAFGVDPCPGSRRFVEVAYKCRPYEFRSKVGCENDVLHLSCNPHSRVAIYSAQYGRTEYDSIQCPQPRGMKEETCLEPYATETAMRECHGKRRCVLSADSNMFGKPCRMGSRTYLKVVYTCVPRTVLKERYESAPEEDEVAHDASELEHDDVDESNDRWWGESAVPPAPAVAAVPPRPSVATAANVTSIVRSEPAPSPRPERDGTNDDIFTTMYAYIIAGVAGAMFLCIIAVVARCVIRKRSRDRPKGPDVSASTEIPNGFNDSISEVDNDINITSLSVPVDTVDSGLKPEMQFTDVALSPKINRYVGRPVPNTYPHVSTNMYGQVAEFPIEIPLRTMPHGTLGRGVAVKTLPRVQVQNETDPNTRSLYRYSNAQYYFG